MELKTYVATIGIDTCIEFNPNVLTPEDRIRTYCRENKCGNYCNNYMCPPFFGSPDDISTVLSSFNRGYLLQYSKSLDVKNDLAGLKQTKLDFHEKILNIEDFLIDSGMQKVWGLIGGSCGLCEVCKAKNCEPCVYPEKARTSLEAIAIDVIALLAQFGLDNNFHDDKITWTGCILLP